MLYRFRAFMKSIIFRVILFTLLIASFALFGLGDLLTDRVSGSSVLEIGDIKVGTEEFQQQYNQRRQELLDNGLNADIIRQYGLPQQVLDSLLARSLFHAESDALGLLPTKQEVQDEIRKTETFQGPGGFFSPNVMQRVLRVSGLSLQDYYALVAANLKINILQDAIWQGHAVAPLSRDFSYLYSQEKRAVDYIKIDTSKLALETQATNEVLQQYFNDNKQDFQLSEKRNISYIYLSLQELQQQFNPPNQMIEDYYQSNIANYQTLEQRAYDFIRFADEVKAQQFYQSLKNKQDFKKNAAAEKLNVINNPLSTKSAIPDSALAEAIYQLNTNKPWSKPIQGGLGFYVAYLQQVKAGNTASLSQVRASISEIIKANEAINIYTNKLSVAEDLGIANYDLAEIAESLETPIKKTGLVNNFGNDANDKNILRDLPPDSRFLSEAFSLSLNNTSYVITIDQSGFYMLNVDEIIAAYTPEFADIKSQIQKSWEQAEKAGLAQKKVAQWQETISQGGTLNNIARNEGYKIASEDKLQRNNDKFGVDVTSAIFAAQQGKIISGQEGNDFYLIHISKLDIPKTVDNGKEYDKFVGRYGQDYNDVIVEAYQSALLDKHNAKINQSLVQQIIGQIEGDDY